MSSCSKYFTSNEAQHCCIANSDITVASSSKSYPEEWCHTPTLSLEICIEILHFLFLLTFSYHWETLYEPHYQKCWVKFTHAGHVILQLILYKLWSKTLLQALQLLSIANSDITVASSSKSYPEKWHVTLHTLSLEISKIFNIFYFYLTFSYHWETLYEPHCQQCWVKFIHAGHVILQLILYKLWSKTLLQAFQPHQLPILTSQLCIQRKELPWEMESHPYLILRNMQEI